jgi:SAM-dependent MidA family methyltransferase
VTPLAQRIAARCPLRFDEFAELALYDPDEGFFTTAARAGRRGDFLTAPEVGPLFGAVVARYLDAEWERLGRPDPFTVVDAGAGPGTLARSIVVAEPRCRDAMRVVLVERSDVQRAAHPDRVDSRASLPSEAFAGVVIANELLDNLPPRLAQRIDERWWELIVVAQGSGFGLDEMPLDEQPEIVAPEGSIIPLHDGAVRWTDDTLRLIEGGSLLVFDYGVRTTSALTERNWTQWLRTYRDHGRGTGVLADVGLQDITCEVAFDQLPTPSELTTQSEWLTAHGVDDLVVEGRRIWHERAAAPDLQALRMRSREIEAAALTDPDGMGNFLVARWEVA